MWPRGASASKHTSAPAGTKVGHIKRYAPNSVRRRQSPEPCRSSLTLTPSRAEGRDKTAKHCLRDKNNHGTELAMKVVRQAWLELSGGSTPDQLRPNFRRAPLRAQPTASHHRAQGHGHPVDLGMPARQPPPPPRWGTATPSRSAQWVQLCTCHGATSPTLRTAPSRRRPRTGWAVAGCSRFPAAA